MDPLSPPKFGHHLWMFRRKESSKSNLHTICIFYLQRSCMSPRTKKAISEPQKVLKNIFLPGKSSGLGERQVSNVDYCGNYKSIQGDL